MVLLPGDIIDLGSSGSSGPGSLVAGEHCYVENNLFYSSVVGSVAIDAAGRTVNVVPSVSCRSQVPRPGQTVLCRVAKVTPRFAGVDIVAVCPASCLPSAPPTRLPLPFKATIRQQDIYSLDEREQAVVYDCFRPTDLVRALVIGTGDTSTGLLLSTGAGVELGVVEGRSVHGGRLVPVAWNEMRCAVSGASEKRKAAKPMDASLQQ